MSKAQKRAKKFWRRAWRRESALCAQLELQVKRLKEQVCKERVVESSEKGTIQLPPYPCEGCDEAAAGGCGGCRVVEEKPDNV